MDALLLCSCQLSDTSDICSNKQASVLVITTAYCYIYAYVNFGYIRIKYYYLYLMIIVVRTFSNVTVPLLTTLII